MNAPQDEAGWGRHRDSPKLHYWLRRGTVSLCRTWLAGLQHELAPHDPAQRTRSTEQCAACWKRLFPTPTATQMRLLLQASADPDASVFVAARDTKAMLPMLDLAWFEPIEGDASLCRLTEKGRLVLAVAQGEEAA